MPKIMCSIMLKSILKTMLKKNFFIQKSVFQIIPRKRRGYLSSYAAASCTEFKNASASDLRAETYIANEMEDSVFANLYLQTAYVEIEIALDSGEKYTESAYTTAFSMGGSCVLTASDVPLSNPMIQSSISPHNI